MVAMIIIIDKENWITTSAFLKVGLFLIVSFTPLSAFIGINDEIKKAGYAPETKPINSVNKNIRIIVIGSKRFNESFFSEKSLKNGRTISVNARAKSKAKKV